MTPGNLNILCGRKMGEPRENEILKSEGIVGHDPG